MTDEAKTVETETEVVAAETQVQEESLPGLFDDEGETLTEDQLSGEEESEKPEIEPEKEAADKKPSTETEIVDPTGKTDVAGKEGESKPTDKKAPPEGFVPYQAVEEERSRRKSLAQENAQLKQKLASIETRKPETETRKPDEFKEFKVLSDQEFKELKDDDPFEATDYLNRLIQFKDYQREQTAKADEKKSVESIREQLIQDGIDEIERAAPGIWDSETGVGQELTAAAEKFGVSRQMSGILSNPGTVIVDPSTGKQTILGPGAAEFVKLVKNLTDYSKGSDPESVRKQIEERVTQEVTERVTKEMAQKFKTGSAGVVSLGDASSHSEQISGAIGNSEEEWARMSDEDRRRALGG